MADDSWLCYQCPEVAATKRRTRRPGLEGERVTFPSRRGNRLVGRFHYAAGSASAGGVILCHGMESTKEGAKHRELADRLSRAGLAVLRFDFSYVGESEGEFVDLTVRGEVEDLGGAWDWFLGRCAGPMGLFGSSLGGTVALLFASGEPRVRTLAVIAALGRPARILEEIRPTELERWRKEGIVSLGGVRLKRSFLEDVESLDVIGACRRISCPALVAHGSEDRVVPASDAVEITAAIGGKAELKIYPGADHRFTDPEHLARLLDDCSCWLANHLGGEPR